MAKLISYVPRLSAFHLQALQQMLESSVIAGEYGGGKLFDRQAAEDLRKQGQDFTSLPSISSGSRAIARSASYPMDLLLARYEAIVAEAADFQTRMSLFLTVLEQDAAAIDQLLSAAELEAWISRLPRVSGAQRFSVDFAATHGPMSLDVPRTDPETSIVYVDQTGLERQPADVSFAIGDQIFTGIGAPVERIERTTPVNLRWELKPIAAGEPIVEEEVLTGEDWAKYTLLTPEPRLSFLPPVPSVILPKSQAGREVIRVKGQQISGNLPVYVRIVFATRRRKATFTVDEAGQVFSLSSYRISKDDMIVTDESQSWQEDQHWQVDLTSGKRDFIALSALVGKEIEVLFNEYYPAYQCSVNNANWSPVIRFDADEPYDNLETGFIPLQIETGAETWFPIIDELGNPMGLSIQLAGTVEFESLIRIDTRADTVNFGATSVLEIEFDRPGYMNGIRLTPFVNFPVRLKQIDAEGMTTGGAPPIFSGNVLLDRPVSIRFAEAVYVRRIFLTLHQENYSLKEHILDPEDKLRQDALARLQVVLPFSDMKLGQRLPRRLVGAQYEFGLRDIAGERWHPAAPGVRISGPFDVRSKPEVVRLDTEQHGEVDCYLMATLLDANRLPKATWEVAKLTPGKSVSFWNANADMVSTDVAGARLYLKWVFRDELSVLQRFCLQVS